MAIYLPRLRSEFYNLKPDDLIFYDRISKEAIHELLLLLIIMPISSLSVAVSKMN